MFKGQQARQGFAIRVTSIISYETDMAGKIFVFITVWLSLSHVDIEEDLQNFFRHLLEKKGLRVNRLRLLKTKDNPPRFINKCILQFDSNESAAKALDLIDGSTYNDAILEASWAEPNNPNRKR